MERYKIITLSVLMGLYASYSIYNHVKKGDFHPYDKCVTFYNQGDSQDFAQCLKDGAKFGDTHKQTEVALMYYNGRIIPKNYTEALKWALIAAKKDEPEAQNLLGVMYANGSGVGQDYHTAVMWYKKSANQGLPTAKYNLARLMYIGKGMEMNQAKAISLFQEAASAGDEHAIKALKILRENGVITR